MGWHGWGHCGSRGGGGVASEGALRVTPGVPGGLVVWNAEGWGKTGEMGPHGCWESGEWSEKLPGADH